MAACKFLEAERVLEIAPMWLACSALSLNSCCDSLNRLSFWDWISFCTSVCRFSEFLNSDSATLLPDSRTSCAFCS